MGYTHYWNNVELNEDIVKETQAILETTNVPVVREFDVKTPPTVSENGIFLNGVEDDGHETFYLTPEDSSNFCKTARKPYDVVVSAILISVILNSYTVVSSDGYANDAEWENGIELYEHARGKKLTKDERHTVNRSIGKRKTA